MLAAAAGAIATALVGGIASAAIPSPSGVIQGCYDSGGNVKVVEALPCPRNYTPLQWNQQGLQGAKGDKGDRGLDGAGAPKSCLVVGDSTPSVAGCTLLQLDGSGGLEVADLVDGVDGQVVTIRAFRIPASNGEVAFRDNSPFLLQGDYVVDTTTGAIDNFSTLTLVREDPFWFEVSRSPNH